VIDDPSIDLFRYPIIKAPVAGLHMKHGNAPTGGDDRGEPAVRIPEDQNLIRLVFDYSLIDAVQDLANLVRKTF
jgi:hypothetical protein